jgi:hypothetical protein
VQQEFRGPYLLAPLSELDLPHVQIEGIVEATTLVVKLLSLKAV